MAANEDEAREMQMEGNALLEQIAPILRGKEPELMAYVCASLLAMHIAHWRPEMREKMLATILDLVHRLIPIFAHIVDHPPKADA